MNNTPDPALLLSPCPPTGEQKQAMEQVLSRRYGRPVVLTWQEDRSISSGFLIKLGDETIDWTAQGRLEQLKQQLSALPTGAGSVIPLIRETVDQWQPRSRPVRRAGCWLWPTASLRSAACPAPLTARCCCLKTACGAWSRT